MAGDRDGVLVMDMSGFTEPTYDKATQTSLVGLARG